MHRFIKGLVLAAIPVAVVAALAGTASAATAKADGTVIVSKGDVQTAMKWNDAQFQANLDKVTFTGTASAGSTQVVSPTTGLWHDYVVTART